MPCHACSPDLPKPLHATTGTSNREGHPKAHSAVRAIPGLESLFGFNFANLASAPRVPTEMDPSAVPALPPSIPRGGRHSSQHREAEGPSTKSEWCPVSRCCFCIEKSAAYCITDINFMSTQTPITPANPPSVHTRETIPSRRPHRRSSPP